MAAIPGPRQPVDGEFGVCLVEGCERARRSRGYCDPHWQRWRKTGDPGPAEIGRKITTYKGVHNRLRAKQGNAADRACVHCGAPADQWAYTNDDPDELVDGEGLRYSLDLDRYVPACHRCHRRLDGSFGEGHHKARLTDEDVQAIRAATSVGAVELARQYGVDRSTIWRVRTSRNWGHVR